MATAATTPADIFSRLVGAEHVRLDEASRSYFARDIFYWPDATLPEAVVAPGGVDELSAVLCEAAAAGLAVVPRGGGMSYTGGYVPHGAPAIVLDLRRLARIRAVDPDDGYVLIEAGATWAALRDAVEPHGLRARYSAPYSGNFSTIGGALAQGTPDDASGVLGLEVVLADGGRVRTGTFGIEPHAVPFLRGFGPDLTGLFLADGGTLGIKTAVALALEPKPRAVGYASFAFETCEAMVRAMIACGRARLPGKAMGLDPRKSQNAPKVGFRDAIQTLATVALAKPTVTGGLRDALGMAAAGRNFMEGVQWSMHVTVEGVGERSVDEALAAWRELCAGAGAGHGEGREIPNLLPMALAASPFSVRGFLGPQGERWVPTNALLPYSAAERAATRVQQYFDSRRAEMERHGMWHSCILAARPGFVLIEPSFYWPDEISRLHADHLDAASAAKFAQLPPDPAARAFAIELRAGLIRTLEDCGSAHVQLAKAYGYRSRLEPGARATIDRIKRALDPEGRLNPGNLER